MPSLTEPAPTITLGSNGGSSTISGATNKAASNSSFRYFNAGGFALAGSTFPNNLYYKPAFPAGSNTSIPYSVEWMHKGSALDIRLKGQGGSYRLWIDDAPLPVMSGPPSNGGVYLLNIAFPSSRTRKIRIDLGGTNGYFGGINIGSADTFYASPTFASRRIIALGDSYTEGTGADFPGTGLFPTLATLLDSQDLFASGVGGTGYLNPNIGRYKLGDRIQTDCIDYSPDMVIIAMGLNDYSVYSASAIQTEAQSVFSTLRTALPSGKIVAMGPWWPNGNPGATLIAARDAIQTAAAASSNVFFVDNIGTGTNGGWITGTGKVTNQVGDGNADTYISSDGTHPTQAGHDYLARKLFAALVSLEVLGSYGGSDTTFTFAGSATASFGGTSTTTYSGTATFTYRS